MYARISIRNSITQLQKNEPNKLKFNQIDKDHFIKLITTTHNLVPVNASASENENNIPVDQLK